MVQPPGVEEKGSKVEERERGSGKVMPGFKLGTPEAQQRNMSARCPQGYRR